MKISLREMIYNKKWSKSRWFENGVDGQGYAAYVFVSQVLEQLELSVGSLRKDRSAKGLHDLLYGDILVRKLVSSRAVSSARD